MATCTSATWPGPTCPPTSCPLSSAQRQPCAYGLRGRLAWHAITIRADAEGVSARELFERFHLRFLDTFQKIGISYDLFTHTDTENHYRVSQDIFTACLDNGYMYQQTERQFYSESEGRFCPTATSRVRAPTAALTARAGDQCDNCKKLLDPTD